MKSTKAYNFVRNFAATSSAANSNVTNTPFPPLRLVSFVADPDPSGPLRNTPALTFVQLFAASASTRSAVSYISTVLQNGKLTTAGLTYRDASKNNLTVQVPTDMLEFARSVDANVICFVTHVIRNSVEDAKARISFFATRAVERLVCLMGRKGHDMDLRGGEGDRKDVEEKEEKDLDLENVVINTSKALTYLAAYPELRDEIKNFAGTKSFLDHFDGQQAEHMKYVKRENKRKAAKDHAVGVRKKLAARIADNERTILELEAAVDFEDVERKGERKRGGKR